MGDDQAPPPVPPFPGVFDSSSPDNPFADYSVVAWAFDWRLDNDTTVREAFYETDSDQTNRFFAQGDGNLMDPLVYRDLILTEHGALNDAHPKRYKRFIVSDDNTHGAVQVTAGTENELTGEPCFPAQPFSFYTVEDYTPVNCPLP